MEDRNFTGPFLPTAALTTCRPAAGACASVCLPVWRRHGQDRCL